MRLLISLFTPFLLLLIVHSQYAIIQANHYEINKYFRYEIIKKIILQSVQLALLIIGFSIDGYWKLIILVFSVFVNVLLINRQTIKYTKRVKRFILIFFSVTSISCFALPFSAINSFLLLNNLILVLLIVCHFLSVCVEMIIMHYYIKDAKKIIEGIKVIGVTGSYGKTSSKNIIYDMLEGLFNVSKTPKSFNTKVGIVKSVRENVNAFDEIFICEYGVDRKGGMDVLLQIVKPNISLITEVGPQHLLTFKNIENITNEKIKLAKCLNQDEIAVINNDNKYLNNVIKNFNCKVITYGVNNESDIMAKNIKVSKEGSSFDLYVMNNYIKRITIKLLGKHNILNTLGAIGVLKAMDVDLENIDYLASKIKSVEHRLQLKQINGIRVIDDSFNSNELGFKNAIDTLCLMEGKKIVITPGIIEQGKNSFQVNYELGEYMSNKVDLAVLVEKNATTLKQGLINGGFNKDKIVIKNDFLEAWEFVKQVEEENKIILIENDLPSIYLK